MSYKRSLYPWSVVRLLPDMRRITVARFSNRSDADGHMGLLRQLIPKSKFVVVFDPPVLSNTPKK
ncbi:hypothetical protein VB834_16820 [Limnoraphis robusta Tam1]|uniref:hypothetical protein n=1 Tax=Limnoraphis robusta TaxID=1118279 RepID=UPI002B1F6F5F|nr:hypothetical protein [Limnoraphis robusta]MEA5499193.1 hypothetical protein [Limnoraphis robusta BA-68 BA1]MEA5540686.1 hypothetical protein [Limnoraphis robusta Tam1]